MGGIFGYVGREDRRSDVLTGVDMLFHRGGDSVGAAARINDDLICVRSSGTSADVFDDVMSVGGDCSVVLAQNGRFMRSGRSERSCAPACNNLFAVAMDGSVDNFYSLRDRTGNPFPILTDEDLILAMLCVANQPKRMDLLRDTARQLSGDPTFAFLCRDENALYCYRGNAPLYVGIAKSGYFISGSVAPLSDVALRYFPLEQGDVLRLATDKAVVIDCRNRRAKRTPLPLPGVTAEDRFIQPVDDLYCCPLAVRSCVQSFVTDGGLQIGDLRLSRHMLDRINSIILTGQGISLNATRMAEYVFGSFTDIPVRAVPSQEIADGAGIMDRNTLLVAVSQSGESMPTIMAARRAVTAGARVIGVTPHDHSCLADVCDSVVDNCNSFGGGNGLLSAFVTSYITLVMLALSIGRRTGVVSQLYMSVVSRMAEGLSGKVTSAVRNLTALQTGADMLLSADRVVATGYMGDLALAAETADFLRTVAHRDCALCPSYDLERVCGGKNCATILAFISDSRYLPTIMSHLRRARVLGASVLIYTSTDIEDEIRDFDKIISVNGSVPILDPVPMICALHKTAILMQDDTTALTAV